jgi:hypothetical protein
VDAFGDEERMEFGDHGRLAVMKNRSESWSSSVVRAARGAAASVTGWP